MAISFRYATLDEYPKIAQFLDDHWARDHVYFRDQQLFEWTFRRAAHWPHNGYSFAMAEDNAELVGILGGIPFAFNRFGKRSAAIWIANYVMRPDHRRGVTALQLLSNFRCPALDPVVAFGINPATAVIYRVLRGEVLPPIPRLFLVLPRCAARMAGLLRIAYPDWSERAEQLAERLCLRAISDQPVDHGDSFPGDWDTKDWPEIADRTIGAARDLDYFNWRYSNHPRFEYRTIAIADGPRTGLLVWRLETIRRVVRGGVREDLDRIGRLVEFLPASRDGARRLMTAFVQQLCASGAFAADYYGFHAETRAWLEEEGFVDVEKCPDGEAIPSRFQPLDDKGGRILSALFLREPAPACTAAPDCPWYWTKSDSDQDRPN